MQQKTVSTFVPLLVNFRAVFNAESYRNFVLLAMSWIACVGRHRLSRVVVGCRELAGSIKHHSAFYRFFSSAAWSVDSMFRVVFRLAVTRVPGLTLYVAVDDTLSRKTGPQIWGAGMHHDPLISNYNKGSRRGTGFAFGLSWVIVSLWVPVPWLAKGGMSVPVGVRLYRSRKTCPEQEYAKRTEIAAQLLGLLHDWMPPDRRLVVIGDREYSCRTVMGSLPPSTVFVGHLPMNAALFDMPRERSEKRRGRKPKKGMRLPNPTQWANSTQSPWQTRTLRIYGQDVTILTKSISCLWYGVTGTRLVRVVVTRDPKRRLDDRAYVCTDSNMAVDEIIRVFALRWCQEVMHRNLKQDMGLTDPQNGWWRRPDGQRHDPRRPGPEPDPLRGAQASQRTVPFILVTYALVILWYLSNGDAAADVELVRRRQPWYRHKTHPSFGDMLAATRRQVVREWNIEGSAWRRDPAKFERALLDICLGP